MRERLRKREHRDWMAGDWKTEGEKFVWLEGKDQKKKKKADDMTLCTFCCTAHKSTRQSSPKWVVELITPDL